MKLLVFCFVFMTGTIVALPESHQVNNVLTATRGSVEVKPALLAQHIYEKGVLTPTSINFETVWNMHSFKNWSHNNNGYHTSIAEARVSAGQNIVPPS